MRKAQSAKRKAQSEKGDPPVPEKRSGVKNRSRTKTRSATTAKARKPVRAKPASKPEVPPDPMHDGSRKPDDVLLRKMLGKTMGLWEELRSHLAATDPPIVEEWKFYGVKNGWSMKVLCGKRNLFFFVPREGGFMAGFTFGEKATEEIMRSRLPERLKQELRESRKYAEGRGLGVEVRTRTDVEAVKELTGIKSRN